MSLPNEFQRYHSAVVEISRHARTQPIEPHLDPVPPQYSLVLWVHQRTQKQIAKVAKVLNREAPGQFIYSPDRYHMTGTKVACWVAKVRFTASAIRVPRTDSASTAALARLVCCVVKMRREVRKTVPILFMRAMVAYLGHFVNS